MNLVVKQGLICDQNFRFGHKQGLLLEKNGNLVAKQGLICDQNLRFDHKQGLICDQNFHFGHKQGIFGSLMGILLENRNFWGSSFGVLGRGDPGWISFEAIGEDTFFISI